jgi:hypothetical protein
MCTAFEIRHGASRYGGNGRIQGYDTGVVGGGFTIGASIYAIFCGGGPASSCGHIRFFARRRDDAFFVVGRGFSFGIDGADHA